VAQARLMPWSIGPLTAAGLAVAVLLARVAPTVGAVVQLFSAVVPVVLLLGTVAACSHRSDPRLEPLSAMPVSPAMAFATGLALVLGIDLVLALVASGVLVAVGAATGLAAAGIAVLDGWLLLRYGGQLPDSMAFGAGVGLAGLIGCALALVTLAVVDVVLTVERTGVVLFVETAPGVWAHRRPHMAPQTTRHYRIAVDDGHSGEVTPWALPAALWNGTCSGDVVQVRVRRLTGLVVRLTPVSTAD